MLDLSAYMTARREMVDRGLGRRLPSASTRPGLLHEAMRYSVLGGGKRIRPTLCLAACEAVGGEVESAVAPALALEILHAYTLIHDDLPCMDDDDLRRGQPTSHIRFGEANALLAGDALLTLAFECVGERPAPPPYGPTQMVLELARAAGSRGVIAGQVEDLAHEGRPLDREELEFIHVHKTAALIRAAVRLGAIAGGARSRELEALTLYGGEVGVAFQIADDILNATGDVETIGKPVGTDVARGKTTYVALYGIDASRQKAKALVDNAVAQLSACRRGPTEPLAALAHFITDRNT